MKRREIVVDLVKIAFIMLIIKVMASTSALIPWNSLVDDLSILFAVCVIFVKICRRTFPLKKLIVLIGVALLAVYTCVKMGQYDLLITVIAICLLIDEDLDAYIDLMFKVQVFIILAHIAVSVLLSLLGASHHFWRVTDNRLRFNAGFAHANVLACYTLSCMLMFAWKQFKHITTNQFAAMACVTVLSYAMSRSRTGLLLNLFLLLLLILTQNENKLVMKAINPSLLLLFPALTVLVFWAQRQYVAGNSIAILLDDLLTGRIKYAAYAYLRSGITWLPRYLDYAASGVVGWTPEWNLNTFTFDNLYSFLFLQMGIIWIGVFVVMIAVVRKKFDFRNKLFMLIWIFYGMVEVHGLNCFKFFPPLLLSTLFSAKGAEEHSICND